MSKSGLRRVNMGQHVHGQHTNSEVLADSEAILHSEEGIGPKALTTQIFGIIRGPVVEKQEPTSNKTEKV